MPKQVKKPIINVYATPVYGSGQVRRKKPAPVQPTFWEDFKTGFRPYKKWILIMLAVYIVLSVFGYRVKRHISTAKGILNY